MSGFSHAGLWSRISFSWVSPLIAKGASSKLDQRDADSLTTPFDDAYNLEQRFKRFVGPYQVPGRPGHQRHGILYRVLFQMYWGTLAVHSVMIVAETVVRLAQPVALREFLVWLVQQQGENGRAGENWKGWLLALAVFSASVIYTLVHHVFVWIGMRMGFHMRQQSVAAIHDKVLRLNSVGLSRVSAGHVVNLISNDVRRFDDALSFWCFVWSGPLELLGVVVLVALELGVVPAIAGVGTTLLVIPVQAVLVRYMGGLRLATAEQTDERVRVEGEAISGALAMKMLGWEEPLCMLAQSVRRRELQFLKRTARIKACNMALQFSTTPIVSFITFSVAQRMKGDLNVPSVFYALSLLHLLKLTMMNLFVLGVQCLTELRISLQRIEQFLSLPEPPLPVQVERSQHLPTGYVAMGGSDYDWQEVAPSREAIAVPGKVVVEVGRQVDEESRWRSRSEDEEEESRDGPGHDRGICGEVPVSSSVLKPRTLTGVRFELWPGELLGVCGEVGSGKSSILAALLGELQPLDPSHGPLLKGQVAYCSQVPWIMAATLRDNILFGHPWDEERYHQVLQACALRQDLEELPAGDSTELGEQGINLSGGQKARVALARAAFSLADIQLLDDPLSAVDPRVGQVLFEQCLGPKGFMAGSTRVLVTHQRQYLPHCDRILVLRKGSVAALGSWKEVAGLGLPELTQGAAAVHCGEEDKDDDGKLSSGPPVVMMCDNSNEGKLGTVSSSPGDTPLHHLESTEEEAVSPGGASNDQQYQPCNNVVTRLGCSSTHQEAAPPGLDTPPHDDAPDADDKSDGEGPDWTLQRERTQYPDINRLGSRWGSFLGRGPLALVRNLSSSWSRSRHSGRNPVELNNVETTSGTGGGGGPPGESRGQLIKAEGRVLGGVSWSVYLSYWKYAGMEAVVLLALLLIVGQGTSLASEWWLSLWAYASPSQQDDHRWLWVYGVLTGVVILVAFLRSDLFFMITLRAATLIHDQMVHRVFRAPLSFFHTNPAGRVLNRFSNDQGRVDEQLPQSLGDVLQLGFMVLGALVLVSIAVPVILPVFLPLVVIFYYIRRRYVITSREVKRLEAITRSPMYAAASATLKGLPTIRAYGVQPQFHQRFLKLMSRNGSWWFVNISATRWLGFRLDVIAAITLAASVFLAVATRKMISPEILGLALTHVLQLTGYLQWWTRQTAEVENTMTSVERMLEYTTLDQEPPTISRGGRKPPPGWPRSGKVRYHSVTARYRPSLPAVLKNLSFIVMGGTTCGVVGRTGSGKSSLMLTLFRLIDITSGTIFLDDVDITTVGLDALRSQLAIIPQDPVLFSGTLRSNLDPWDLHGDSRMWEVLAAVQLKETIMTVGGLDTRMAECGQNLSVGQRQLFCLARALLQDAKVLALDEATANVDRATDALIQEALRASMESSASRAAGRVLLVIAHRIDTILDCDQLLVLSNGVLHENGPPEELLQKEGGVFRKMADAARRAHGGGGS